MRLPRPLHPWLLAAWLPLAGCADPDANVVQGTIRLAAGSTTQVAGSDALFITARPAGSQGGPPLAVLKVVGVKFPLAYRIGQEDVMMPGTWFRGKVEIRATLRRSGFVGVPMPGDMEGRAAGAVEPGAKGVDFELRPAAAAGPPS